MNSDKSRRRIVVLGVCAFMAVGVGAAVGLSTARRAAVTPAPANVSTASLTSPATAPALDPTTPPAMQPSPPAIAPGAKTTEPGPSFDIVRVAPDGSAVLAGRAAPNTAVTVQEAGRTVGEAQTDARGAWVMVPEARLPPGAGELTLSAKAADGRQVMAEAPVIVVVPTPAPTPAAQPSAPALALLTPPSGPSRLLQSPSAAAPAQKLGLDTVDYDEHGAIRFSGTAPPQAPVRAYVDNGPVGDATADTAGRWAMSPPREVEPGLHQLRVDQLTQQGQVANRLELPFKREELALSQVAAGQVIVQPGQNLWRLARRAYGAGIRYTVIFMANRDQIRDARLIYPGQVFATPGAVTPAATMTH